MFLERHGTQNHAHVAVWFVECRLLELLHHHLALHIDLALFEGHVAHTVTLHPEGELGILFGERNVVVCHVVGGICIVLAAGTLQRLVERRHSLGTLEHKMLEKVRYTGVLIALVACSHAIEEIHIYHLRITVGYMQHAQSVWKCSFIEGH